MRPDFDDLIGPDVEPAERERLRRAHEALLIAGPPPALPAALARPRRDAARPRPLLLLAAALAVGAAFAGGWLVGGTADLATDFTLQMHGTPAAPTAAAKLVVYEQDPAGNWPMEMELAGLPDGRYELVLTRDGEPAASCGSFLVRGDTVAHLNAPYRLREYDGWAIVRPGSDRILLRTDEI